MNNKQTNTPKRHSLVPTIDDLTRLAQKTSVGSNSLLSSQDSLNSDPFRVFDYSLGNGKKLTGIVESQSSSNSGIDGVNLPIAPSQQLAPYVANQLIVKFKQGVTDAQIEHIKNGLGIVSTKTIGLTGAEVWKLSGTTSVENALARYQSNSLFEYIEPDYKVSPTSQSSSFSVSNQKLTSVNPTLSNSSSKMAISPSSGIDGVSLLIAPSQQLAPCVANQLIVKFKEGVTATQIDKIKNGLGIVSAKTINLTGAQIWKFSGISVESVLAKYGASPLFEYIEPDYIVTSGALTPKSTIPNDPSFTQLWGLNNTGQSGGTPDADIDAPEAWDIQKGNPNLVIGVIDSGVDYNHPDLVGNIWTNPSEIAGDSIDNDGNGYVDDIRGWDFAYNDNNPMDVWSHGTHVSGTIAGKGNNGVGVTGVAWNAKIMPLKFLGDNGNGSTSNAILAIDYATAKGVKLTNNSWGGGGFSQALYDSINAAGQLGALFVAAAGNESNNNDANLSYPASYNLANIISVASTIRTDSLSSFSNYGLTSVDLGAPGSDIYSTTPGNTYSTKNGTSMAAPHVTGAAALLWSQNPTWTAQQVKNTLMNTGDSIAALAGKTVSGKRLNVYNALVASSLPSVTIAVSPVSVQEDGATNLVYTFTRSSLGLSSPLTVNFGVSGIANATPVGSDPADYSLLTGSGFTFNPTTKTGTVTFAANVNTVQVVVDPIADSLAEITSETAVLTVSSGTGYIGGSPNSATGTIVSEEALPIFSNTSPITIQDATASNPYPSTINVSGLSGNLATLKVTLTNLSHTFPDDIDILLVGPNGAKSILMSDVGRFNALSNVTLTFDPLATAALPDDGIITSGTYLPTDFTTGDLFNSPAPVGPYGTSFSVFNNANPNGLWSLYIMDDSGLDSGSIAGGWSLNIGTTSPNNPTLVIAATNANQTEGTSVTKPFTFTVTRAVNTTGVNAVNWAVTGSGASPANITDFAGGVLPTGIVSWAAGDTISKVITVNIQGDTTVEPNENFTVTLSNPTNGATITTATAIGTILNDDTAVPTLAIAATNANQTEGTSVTKPFTFTVTRAANTTGANAVNWTVTGSGASPANPTDFAGGVLPTGSVSWTAGDTISKVITVNVQGDTTVEPNENFTVTLSNPTNGATITTATAIGTIQNDDGATSANVTLASNYSGVSENGKTNLVYNFARTGGTTSPLTVNFTLGGTATRNSDYSAYGGNFLTESTGNVVFATGATTAKLDLVTMGDTVKEANETIAFTLASGTSYAIGTPGTVTTTIINDDGVLNQQGTAGNDVIEAGTTRILSGKGGNDILIGSGASDILSGGLGNDILTSGNGFDTFQFASRLEGIDTLTDFNVSQDIIQLSGAGFGGGLVAGEG